MEDWEIVANYRNRANPSQEQIRILQQLNPCKSKEDILSVLYAAGEALNVDMRGRQRKPMQSALAERWQYVLMLKASGYSTEQIVQKTGLPKTTIYNWKRESKRTGLTIPDELLRKEGKKK